MKQFAGICAIIEGGITFPSKFFPSSLSSLTSLKEEGRFSHFLASTIELICSLEGA